jgi:phenylacetate-CoA ligase
MTHNDETYNQRLLASIKYAYENVPFYRDQLKDIKITSINDLKSLPICSKKHFENKPISYITGVKPEELSISFATTGTTKKPCAIHLTRNDFQNWLVAKARDALVNYVGLTDSDVVANTFGFGLVQPGCEYTFAAIEAGAHVYPVGPGPLTPSKETIHIINQRGVTAVFATPYYSMRLTDVALEMGVNPTDLGVKRFVVTGENLTCAARKRIEESWRTEVFNVFGMSEVGVVGVECSTHKTLHILSNYLYPELTNLQILTSGVSIQAGELVLTSIEKFGMPFVRFNTHDLVELTNKKCSCGVSETSITSYHGRSDGMMKIKGKGIYPSRIEEILLSTVELSSEYQIVLEHGTYFDSIAILAEAQRGTTVDETFKNNLRRRIKEELGLNLSLKIYDYGKLPRSESWKARRIVEQYSEEPSPST